MNTINIFTTIFLWLLLLTYSLTLYHRIFETSRNLTLKSKKFVPNFYKLVPILYRYIIIIIIIIISNLRVKSVQNLTNSLYLVRRTPHPGITESSAAELCRSNGKPQIVPCVQLDTDQYLFYKIF